MLNTILAPQQCEPAGNVVVNMQQHDARAGAAPRARWRLPRSSPVKDGQIH
jgi:hypothetical protein